MLNRRPGGGAWSAASNGPLFARQCPLGARRGLGAELRPRGRTGGHVALLRFGNYAVDLDHLYGIQAQFRPRTEEEVDGLKIFLDDVDPSLNKPAVVLTREKAGACVGEMWKALRAHAVPNDLAF